MFSALRVTIHRYLRIATASVFKRARVLSLVSVAQVRIHRYLRGATGSMFKRARVFSLVFVAGVRIHRYLRGATGSIFKRARVFSLVSVARLRLHRYLRGAIGSIFERARVFSMFSGARSRIHVYLLGATGSMFKLRFRLPMVEFNSMRLVRCSNAPEFAWCFLLRMLGSSVFAGCDSFDVAHHSQLKPTNLAGFSGNGVFIIVGATACGFSVGCRTL